MAYLYQESQARRRAKVNAILSRDNAGFLRGYSGTPPASPDAALAGNTLLFEIVLGNPAWTIDVALAQATANASTPDAAADATATCAFCRLYASDGVTCEAQGSAGVTSEAFNLNTVSIVAGTQVALISMLQTQP